MEKTGEPAIYTNVLLKGTTYGTSTDDNGYFNLTRIPLGKYTLMATSIGYDTATIQVELTKANLELKIPSERRAPSTCR